MKHRQSQPRRPRRPHAAAVIAAGLCALAILATPAAAAHPGSGIVVDANGEIYFTDTGMGVWKLDRAGKLTLIPASLFHWMILDAAGSFAGSGKQFGEWFERVTPQNIRPALITCSDFPLTLGADGHIYYADTRRGFARIVGKSPDGTETVVAAGPQFREIAGITAGPDGSLYVADVSRADASIIRRIGADGSVSAVATIFAGRDSLGSPPPETAAAYCRGLAVDSGGVVYVAATGTRSVIRIRPDGNISTVSRSEGRWSPTGVALFHGEVYVLEWRDAPASQTEVRKAWAPQIRRIGRDGSVTTLAAVARE